MDSLSELDGRDGIESEALHAFVADVDAIVARGGTERELTGQVAARMRILLGSGSRFIDEALCVPASDRYVMYPLHVDPAGRYSIASAVWGVGHETPIHDHGTWGVIGIYAGAEDERRYEVVDRKPVLVERRELQTGSVEVCCTTDADVHAVACASDIPCVGLHVYGGDIGRIRRRAYDTETRDVTYFVSEWSSPVATG